ncbi:hypothetical protein [Candidatus Endomicrobiellum agilis]|uniref:hypothetical protein n=1 Tax=Candidatus Endomicrobiellum agilis TaxID=3238957 RepID=UPI00357946E5|nr:hypothetical protein [Endomicrobium sp.]
MNSIGWILISITAALISLCIVAATVFLALVLIRIRKAVIEFENTIRKATGRLNIVNKVSGKVASIGWRLSSLVISAISFLFYVFLNVNKKKDKK